MTEPLKTQSAEELGAVLTTKQRAFADTYLMNGLNAQAAARAVQYARPREASEIRYATRVDEYIKARLAEAGFTPAEIMRRLEYFATGDMQDFLQVAPSERSYWIRADQHAELREVAKRRGTTPSGLDNYDVAGLLGSENVAVTEDGVMMVCIKTLSAEVSIDWRGAEEAKALGRIKKIKIAKDGAVEFELHDPVKTLELIGKAHSMFTDNVKLSGQLGVVGIDYITAGAESTPET